MTENKNPSPLAARSAEPQVWVWDTGLGNTRLFNIACLAGASLFVREGILTSGGKNKIVNALGCGIPPVEVLSAAAEIPFTNIRELRFSEELCLLEIHHRTKMPIVVSDKQNIVPRDLYDVLRKKLAPTAKPSVGQLMALSTAMTPLIGLWLTIIVGILFTTWAIFAEPNPRNAGRKAGFKNGIDVLLSKIGVLGTLGISLAVAALFAGWLIYRMKNPHQAEVIQIETHR